MAEKRAAATAALQQQLRVHLSRFHDVSSSVHDGGWTFKEDLK